MRPLKLKIEGIKSFVQSQVIDFEQLSSSGVYGIFGENGSGKSTIIAAMLFSLYGRLEQLKLEDFVNSRSKEGTLEFVFGAADKSGVERIFCVNRRIRVQRSKKNSEHNADLYDITSGKVAVASGADKVSEYIESLTGLSQSDMKKCVFLEQNKYDEFVKASESVRKMIVGNLFGLQKYGADLAAKIKNREAACNIEYSQTEARLGALRERFSGIETLPVQIERLRAEYAVASKNLDELSRLCDALKEKAKTTEEAGKLKNECEIAQKNYEFIKTSAQKKHKDFDMIFGGYEEKVAGLNKQVSAFTELANIQSELKKLSGKQGEAAKKNEQFLSKNKAAIDAVLALKQEAALTKEKLHGAIERFNLQFGQGFDFSDPDLCTRLEIFEREFARKSGELSEAKERAVLKAETLANLKLICQKAVQNLEEIRAEKTRHESRQRAIKQQKQMYENALEQAKKSNMSAYLAKGLSAGDLCPVCGGTVTKRDLLHESPDIENAEKKLSLTAAEEDKEAQLISALSEKILNIEKEQLGYIKDIESCSNEINLLNQKIADCKLPDNAPELVKKTGEFVVKVRAAKAAEALREQKIKDITLEIALTEKDITTVAGELSQIEASITQLKSKLKKPEDTANDAYAELAAAESNLEKLTRDYPKAKAELEAELQRLKQAEMDFMLKKNLLKPLEERLQKFDNTNNISELPELEAERGRCSGRVLELHTEIELGLRKLEDAKKNAEEIDALTKKAAGMKKHLDNLLKLKSMTSGNRLMDWIAREYSIQFTADASQLFSDLTGGQMNLEYGDDGFWVVFSDGVRRKLITLSGGETFLASLSVAIAVAQVVAASAKVSPVKFMFVDEGFGTLSEKKIDLIISALNNLAKSDLTVWLVSHVQKMQQVLPAHLFLERADESSGTIVRLRT